VDWIDMNTPLNGRGRHGAPTRLTRLRFALVGPGRVGSALAAALAAAGHHVAAVADRHRPLGDQLSDLSDLDLILLTVPDDALAGVVQQLSTRIRPGQVVVHTSGAHGLAVLAAAAAAGAVPIAMHPAMTFTGTPTDRDRLDAGISFGVTAPPDARQLAARLVADLGGWIEWIAEPDRPMYHAALAAGTNHLVTLVNEAADRLRDAGIGEPARVLAPLRSAALDNALRLGDAALTGPVVRGDAGTVAAHLGTLAARAPESVPAYVALARRTVDRAITAGRLTATSAEPLLDLLAAGQVPRARPRPADVIERREVHQ
jgi:predicted short-subunit dehydrogenase-like oxidoreductase (DUF2520 family)